VVSIDPKRVYMKNPMQEEEESADSRVVIVEESNDEHPLLAMLRGTGRTVVHLSPDRWGPNGEEYCWWPVTVKGGRELRSIDAILLAKVTTGHVVDSCEDVMSLIRILLLGSCHRSVKPWGRVRLC